MDGPKSEYTSAIRPFRDKMGMYSGAQNHYVADASGGDLTVPSDKLNCRYAEVGSTGIIKFSYQSDNGSERTRVKQVVSGEKLLYPNITKIYKTYDGSTVCTSQVYTDAGSIVIGLVLCY